MRIINVFVIFLLISTGALAQESKESLLHITGQSRMAVKPTLAVVKLSIRTSNETYAGAVQDLTNRVDLLVQVLKGLDFSDKEILTSNFSVDKNYVYVQGERREKGFNGVQTLSIQFLQNEEKLLRVLTNVARSKADPEISVSFDLDEESKAQLKQELMLQAVSDAKSKAQGIAEAADHQVIGIKEIRYGQSSGSPYDTSPAVFEMATRADAQVNSFEATDLVFTDRVLIVYLIQAK